MEEDEATADPVDFQRIAVGQAPGREGRGLEVIVGAQAVDRRLPAAPLSFYLCLSGSALSEARAGKPGLRTAAEPARSSCKVALIFGRLTSRAAGASQAG